MLAAPELQAAASATDLRTAESLRGRWPADLVAAASEQAELRERAGGKLTGIAHGAASMQFPVQWLLTRAGLEQATATSVATHRAGRIASVDGVVADLCCGIGSDLRALARVAPVIGVDRDETHAVCARHNAGVPVAVADVRDLRLAGLAAVFIDPARRSGDRRGGSEPPLDWCFDLPLRHVAVKAAPGIDVRVVPDRWEVEFVAEGRDLKEACLWSPAFASARRRATVLPSGESLLISDNAPPPRVQPPGEFVLDPSPAVTRAGAVTLLAEQLGAWQIDRQIAFLSANHRLSTPFGRELRVEASLPFAVKALSSELRRLDVGAVDIRRRGLAGDVEELQRKLRPRGSRKATVLLTRVINKPWTLVCTDPEAH